MSELNLIIFVGISGSWRTFNVYINVAVILFRINDYFYRKINASWKLSKNKGTC